MARIEIDDHRCKGCGRCVVHCPKGLIEFSAELNERGCRTGFQLRQVHECLALLELLRRYYLETTLIIRILVLRSATPAATVRIALALVARFIRAIFS